MMKELGWKVGVTLDIEEDICNVVGKLMMEVAEQDRIQYLGLHAKCNYKHPGTRERERSSIVINSESLLMTKKKYSGLNRACILLEQMILDNTQTTTYLG